METVGTLSAIDQWNTYSFSEISNDEEADFMAQLLSNYSCPNDQDPCLTLGIQSSIWPTTHVSTMNMTTGNHDHHQHHHEQTSYYYCSSDSTVNNPNNVYYYPHHQEEINYSSRPSIFLPTPPRHEIYYLNNSNPTYTESSTTKSSSSFPDNVIEEPPVCMKQEMSNGSLEDPCGNPFQDIVLISNKKFHQKRKSDDESLESDHTTTEVNNTNSLQTSPKKKSRSSSDVSRNKIKSVQKKKKNQKAAGNDEEARPNAGINGQSSCSYNSEDESNASQELNGGSTSTASKKSSALNLSGKTRASRGSATDPQSLYARKRRERINERLRILQNLVPNGTKVDISTMLEEAVEYVKFLKLQIKLLSSDDLWMYAPIAYNGMDIGLDRKLPSQP